MVHYKLTYFNLRARAELIRLIFAVADEKYEDVRVEREKFATTLKPSEILISKDHYPLHLQFLHKSTKIDRWERTQEE